eukprot:CAMPEP_0174989614 /NCGR_PEP_ID=MMETSP0004_2-20121128/20831_1 /TAXON_ID=420556 /ORGANISM="Ochromonas sp., Strain CCMP1393" /LENGTH=658 /DNA_ID=CAMNT_0016243065 /DNA_START=318 /DNA_END=2294 /DNA_ORIENTATION=+
MTSNPDGAQAVLDWLAQNTDISVTWQSLGQHYIKAEAKISTWEALLNTEFYQYEDLSKADTTLFSIAERFVNRATTYSLPSDIKDKLSAVFGTVQVPPEFHPDFHSKEFNPKKQLRTDLRVKSRSGKRELSAKGVTTVEFLNEYYEIGTNTGDSSMQQAVFETSTMHFSPSDLTQFQQNYGLPEQSCEDPQDRAANICTFTTCGEGNLDVQYIMGIAQQTATIFWYVGGADPFTHWITEVANTANPPLVNSMSWGSTESLNSASTMTQFNTEAMKLAAMGVTIMVSAGDNGAAGSSGACTTDSSSSTTSWTGTNSWTGQGYFPSFPATSPYVTAVGATMGPEKGNPEITCQSQEGGVITSGGGFSGFFAQPSWQSDLVSAYFSGLTTAQQPTSGYNVQGRAYPDIAMLGADYEVIVQGYTTTMCGTSASAPVFAGMVSLLNYALVKEGKPSVGYLNPTLWSFAETYTYGAKTPTFEPLYDITEGDNKCTSGTDPSSVVCCASGFTATTGWDPLTGLGSVHFGDFATLYGADVSSDDGGDSSGDGDDSNALTTWQIIMIALGGLIAVGAPVAGLAWYLCFFPKAALGATYATGSAAVSGDRNMTQFPAAEATHPPVSAEASVMTAAAAGGGADTPGQSMQSTELVKQSVENPLNATSSA